MFLTSKRGGGTIKGQIASSSPIGSVNIEETGRYTAERYSLAVRAKQTTRDQPTIETSTLVEARRVGDCID